MFYTWDFMQKEISLTSKMFYFMVPPVYTIYSLYHIDYMVYFIAYMVIIYEINKFVEVVSDR